MNRRISHLSVADYIEERQKADRVRAKLLELAKKAKSGRRKDLREYLDFRIASR